MDSSKFQFKTPVLLIIFNRLDTTKKALEAIKKVKPPQLFIAADGPRNNKEKEKTDKVRNYVLENIDWKCTIKTLFRTKNLGCKYGPSGGIKWFFEHVEQGIILEDDCFPDQSFFRFCQELLEKYKDEEDVMLISGDLFLDNFKFKNNYLFSNHIGTWGWATWRRAWKKCDLEFKEYNKIKKEGRLKEYYPSIFERIIVKKRVKDCIQNKIAAWDFPWSISIRLNNGISVIPSVNMVQNIGFSDATHTHENKWDRIFMDKPAKEMSFPLKHLQTKKICKKYDSAAIRNEIKRMILKKLPF